MKKALPHVIALCWVLMLFTQQAHAFKTNSSNSNASFNPPVACPTSIPGYTALGEFGDSKYFISDNASKWSAAQIDAQANGGHLASITSQEENDFVLANINEIVFIGFNDSQNEGNFDWDSGETFSFSKFTDTNTDGKDFGKMNFWNGNWGLDNQFVSRRAILEVSCNDGGGGGGDCPTDISGFTSIGEFGDSKYYLSDATSQPAAAQILAESNGGNLAVISSQAENDFIQQNINIMTFIGLNDVAAEGNLEWFNGESVTFDNIDPCGFCEENSESMDYVIMAPWNGTWSFSSQFNSRPFVMEITCDDDGGGGGDECSFNTTFSTADAGSSLTIASISENTSNATYEFFTDDVDNTVGGEVVKYPINISDGQLQNSVSITRAGSADETDFSTYWDLESNLLYLAKIVSTDLILLEARDHQANTLFSQNIDISTINFEETINIKVVNNEIILAGNSGTNNNISVIKTDLNGNPIWIKELATNLPGNIPSSISLNILGASNAGGFYLYYDYFGNTIFKISDTGELEWDANVNDAPTSGEFTFRIGEGGERFYLKRIKTNPSLSYMAAFDVNTGALVWDFRAEEASAAHEDPNATIINTVITEAIPTLDGGVIMFYTYDVLPPQPVGPPSTVRKYERYDANGNLVWSRDNQLTFLLGRTKLIASNGGFIFADPVNFNSDNWRVVRMNSDGSFEPDCDDIVIGGECSFISSFSTANIGPNSIQSFAENTSNSSYELISTDVDNTTAREVVKYSLNATTGELESTTPIIRPGAADETGIQTYWDFESNTLYGIRAVSDELLTLWAKDDQGNFIFSKDIDISDIEFVFPYVRVVHGELILTASSTTTNTFPIIKTDINGNLIWKKEITSNVMTGVGIQVYSESQDGGFYLSHEFGGAIVFKFSAAGNFEWSADLNNLAGFKIILGESADGQRFYIKSLNFGATTDAYLAAFDVNTGSISWDYNAGVSLAGGADFAATIFQAVPANDGGVVLYYNYNLLSDPNTIIYRHERFDVNGNLVWERETPESIVELIGEKKVAATDGGFLFASQSFDTWRVLRMTSDGYFEPDCGDGAIDNECFNTPFSTADAGPVKIAKLSENTSNSSYEVFSEETDNFLSRETNKYSINAATGELESTTTITRTGTADESDFGTYWDFESNILYGAKDVSDDLLTLWAKDSQGNFLFSKNIDISDLEFAFPSVGLVNNELIITANSTTTNTFPIIKTDLNGNLIWKKEIPSNIQSGVGIKVYSESKAGGFYLFHQFGNAGLNAFVFKLSDSGDLEWTADLVTPEGSFYFILGESADGQRFYMKRLTFGATNRAYMAAFDVSTGNISWDFNAGESYYTGPDYQAVIYQIIPANDGGAVVFYYHNVFPSSEPSTYQHARFDINGNLIWERDTPDGIANQLGENKIAASDGGFILAGEDFQLTDTWRVVRMTSDGYFAPDCGEGGGDDCSTFVPEAISGFSYQTNVGNKYYYLSDDTARPTDAQANCVSNGGHLATINSQEINDALQPFTNSLVYIGLNDETTEGTLEWRSGPSVDFTNFDDCSFCEPNSESRDYAAIQGWNGKWSWSGFYNARRYWLEIDCTDSNNTNTLITLPSNEIKTDIVEKLDFQKIVPNPALNHIFVQVKASTEMPIEVEIYDARGSLLKTQSAELFNGINAVEVDVSDLVSGFYFVKIPQLKGGFSTKRFVKIRD